MGTGPEIRPVRPLQRRILLYLELTAHISPTAVDNGCMRLWVHLQKRNNRVGWQVADQTQPEGRPEGRQTLALYCGCSF